MIEFGRSVRWFNDYNSEVNFSKLNEFDFMQVWFMKGELILEQAAVPKEIEILNSKFPSIIHAVYDIDDYDRYNNELIRILRFLNHKELIIHPICETRDINEKTIYNIANNIRKTNQLLKANNIKLCIENNSIIDRTNYSPSDLKILFDRNPDVDLLLDVAHIDNYKHLEKILEVKFPNCLHISDKRFNKDHEHLPIGQGELDFELIFREYLKGYNGKVIFEIVGSDEEIINSKKIIEKIFKK